MAVLVTIKGLIVDSVTNSPVVVLQTEDGERALPIWIGPSEANAIALQLENVAPPRPMTHDLLKRVIGDLKGIVESATVTEFKDGTFFAVIEVRLQSGERVLIDSRPSDAIALALRVPAPIYVEEAVLQSATDGEVGRPEVDRLQRWLETIDPDDLGKYKM